MTWEEERKDIISWAPTEYRDEDGTFDEVSKVPKRVYCRLIAMALEMFPQYGDKEVA